MKYLIGALTAVTLLVGVAAAQPAEARCFWNGAGWNCWNHPHEGWYHHHHHYWHRDYWHHDW